MGNTEIHEVVTTLQNSMKVCVCAYLTIYTVVKCVGECMRLIKYVCVCIYIYIYIYIYIRIRSHDVSEIHEVVTNLQNSMKVCVYVCEHAYFTIYTVVKCHNFYFLLF